MLDKSFMQMCLISTSPMTNKDSSSHALSPSNFWLVVVFSLDTFHYLLLRDLASRLLVLVDARPNSSLDPVPCGDTSQLRVGIRVISQSLKDFTLHRSQLKTILGTNKVENAQAINTSLVRRRHHDSVDAALEEAICEELQSICHVDRDASIIRLDPVASD